MEGVLACFEEDKKEFHNTLSPFLSDAEIEEDEQDVIIGSLWSKLKGDVATPHTKVLFYFRHFLLLLAILFRIRLLSPSGASCLHFCFVRPFTFHLLFLVFCCGHVVFGCYDYGYLS